MAQEGVSEEAMLPFSAGLPALASRYVAWLHAQEAQGWQFAAAEVRIEALPTGRAALVLNGRIDRIDTHRASGTVRLIDYKTSARKALEDKVRVPLEDTQLAVYVALQSAREPDMPAIEACYLALDEADEVVAVPHEGVAATAQILTERIAAELARIEAGAPLPALGEGPVCETCEARGLCRRDHWSDEGAAHAS
jgi:ATP-dependent helicase/nuclease subunit B